jgi:hypothetical protein
VRNQLIFEIICKLKIDYVLDVLLFKGLLTIEVNLADAVETIKCLLEPFLYQELGCLLDIAIYEDELDDSRASNQHAPHHSPVLK